MLVFSQNICASFSLGRGLSHTFSNLYFGSKLIHEPKMLFSFFCSASRRHWTSHFLLKHGIIFVLFVHEGGEPTSNSYMIVNSKVTSLLLMAGLVTYVQPLHHQTRMGGGGGLDLISATADNSINESFAVTVLLDPSVTLLPKGNWIHLVSQKQLSDSEKYFSNWIRGLSKCLQMMPLMSALLEFSSSVGNIAKLQPFARSVTLCCDIWSREYLFFVYLHYL